MTVSPYIWAAVGVSASVFVLFVVFVVSLSLMAVYVCYVQKRHATQERHLVYKYLNENRTESQEVNQANENRTESQEANPTNENRRWSQEVNQTNVSEEL